MSLRDEGPGLALAFALRPRFFGWLNLQPDLYLQSPVFIKKLHSGSPGRSGYSSTMTLSGRNGKLISVGRFFIAKAGGVGSPLSDI